MDIVSSNRSTMHNWLCYDDSVPHEALIQTMALPSAVSVMVSLCPLLLQVSVHSDRKCNLTGSDRLSSSSKFEVLLFSNQQNCACAELLLSCILSINQLQPVSPSSSDLPSTHRTAADWTHFVVAPH